MLEMTHNKLNGFSYLLFNNVFDDEELSGIWKEAQFLCDPIKLNAHGKTGGQETLKKNSGVFLNGCYSNRNLSNYLRSSHKIFSEMPDSDKDDIGADTYLAGLFSTDTDVTLFSYYGDGDLYKAHRDDCAYTFAYWLYKDPKQFSGGSFSFPDFGVEIECQNNSGVLFPSWALHEVSKVDVIEKKYEGYGRFSYTTFYGFRTA